MWLEKHLRHRSGFGVHSPMLYRVVREAMMPRRIVGSDCDLYEALRRVGVRRRTATRLQNLYTIEGHTAWRINEPIGEGELGIATPQASDECVRLMAKSNGSNNLSTLCLLHPLGQKSRRALCKRLIEEHRSMSASKQSFTLLFTRKDLHKQHIVI